MMQNTGNATNQSGILLTLNFLEFSTWLWCWRSFTREASGVFGFIEGRHWRVSMSGSSSSSFLDSHRLTPFYCNTRHHLLTLHQWLQNLHCTDKFLTWVLTWLVYMQLLPFLSLICSKEQRALCPLLKTCRHCSDPCICTWDQWKSSFEGFVHTFALGLSLNMY